MTKFLTWLFILIVSEWNMSNLPIFSEKTVWVQTIFALMQDLDVGWLYVYLSYFF